jgi:antibiotic biosynthesis monooxygenase (ABM) superfamily enzyme
MTTPVLYMVRASITADREREWNEWYDTIHLPAMRKFPGVLSARRYRAIMGEDTRQYVTCVEFESEAAFRAYMASDYLQDLIRDYDARYGDASPRTRSAYRQVLPAQEEARA